jgi:hypothetical protein
MDDDRGVWTASQIGGRVNDVRGEGEVQGQGQESSGEQARVVYFHGKRCADLLVHQMATTNLCYIHLQALAAIHFLEHRVPRWLRGNDARQAQIIPRLLAHRKLRPKPLYSRSTAGLLHFCMLGWLFVTKEAIIPECDEYGYL